MDSLLQIIGSSVGTIFLTVGGLVLAARPSDVRRAERNKVVQFWIFASIVTLGLLTVGFNVWGGISSQRDLDGLRTSNQQMALSMAQTQSTLKQNQDYLQARIDYALRPLEGRKFTPQQLAVASASLARQMRAFYQVCANQEERALLYPATGPARLRQIQMQNAVNNKCEITFDEKYRGRAIFYYRELVRRLPPQPEKNPGESMAFLDGDPDWHIMGRFGADRLESLALQLDPGAEK